MSLQVWLPLTKDLRQQGLRNIEFFNSGITQSSTGKLGGSYYFAGNVLAVTNFSISPTTWSICYWVNYTLLPSSSNFYQVTLNGSTSSDYLFMVGGYSANGTTGVFRCNMTGDCGTINKNTWYHVCATYNGSKCKLYINGELLNTFTIGVNANKTNLVIGGRSNSATNDSWVGVNGYCYLNDIRIYDHTLSPMEVKRISQGLVLHYPLNDKYIESTSNIITSLKAGGRTNVIGGDKIQNTGENSDTYFYLMSPGLVAGEIYTLSYYCQGLSGSNPDWKFGVGAQSSTHADHCGYIPIQNGWNYLTFVCPNSLNGNTQLILDDFGATWRTSIVTFSNFQLEHANYKTGIQPINTWCGAKLTANTIIGSNGAISSSSGWYTTDYIPIIPNKSYKLTGLSKGGSGTYVALFDSNQTLQRTLLITANQDVSFTASANEYFLQTSIRNLAYELTTTAKLIYLDSIEYDTSGYCNNGTRTGTFNWTSDTPKYSVSQYFNGSSYIVTDYYSNLGTGDFTISAWIKLELNSSKTYQPIIINKGTSAASAGCGIYFNHNQNKFLWSTGDGSASTEIWTANTFADVYDKWVHVVMIRNSNDEKKGYFYINGVREELASVPVIRDVTNDIYPMVVGAIGPHNYVTYQYTGNISDIRIYATALSAHDIRALYENSAYIANNGTMYAYDFVES